MHNFRYDFSIIEKSMYNIQLNPSVSKIALNELKDELNKFFKGARCNGININNNTDKMFFGMCVMPYIPDSNIRDIIFTDKKVMIKDYNIEIDSKLLELNLSYRELTACLLHEVGHVVNDTTSIDTIKNALDVYSASNDFTFNHDKIYKLEDIFKLAISQSIYKINSLFTRTDEEMIADSFVVACGYGQELSSAYKIILRNTTSLNKTSMNKLVELHWALKLYQQFSMRRIPAIDSLTYAGKVEPSELVKNKIKFALNSLKSNRLNSLEESALTDKFKTMMYKSDSKDLRDLEEELYEYDIRIKNCDDQDDALILVRELNIRISILDDFLFDSKGKPLSEKARLLKSQYEYLRKELTKKKLYGEKYYGLFVKTPVIKSRYEV